MPPFIVTLAGMFLARGASFLMSTESTPISAPLYSTVSDFALRLPGGGRLTAIALIMLAVVAAGAVLLHFTRFGANVYALGGSRATTALMGIPVGSMTVRIYMLSSVLAGLAGIVFSFYTAAGYSLSAVGVELDSIAAVVIGGTLLTGGAGVGGRHVARRADSGPDPDLHQFRWNLVELVDQDRDRCSSFRFHRPAAGHAGHRPPRRPS